MIIKEYRSPITFVGPVEEFIHAFVDKPFHKHFKDVSFVKRCMENPNFYRFSMDREREKYTLMVEYEKGKVWFVVGFCDEDISELPTCELPTNDQ